MHSRPGSAPRQPPADIGPGGSRDGSSSPLHPCQRPGLGSGSWLWPAAALTIVGI